MVSNLASLLHGSIPLSPGLPHPLISPSSPLLLVAHRAHVEAGMVSWRHRGWQTRGTSARRAHNSAWGKGRVWRARGGMVARKHGAAWWLVTTGWDLGVGGWGGWGMRREHGDGQVRWARRADRRWAYGRRVRPALLALADGSGGLFPFTSLAIAVTKEEWNVGYGKNEMLDMGRYEIFFFLKPGAMRLMVI